MKPTQRVRNSAVAHASGSDSPHESKFVIGLTGSIGAGKSTVAELLARRYGAEVINADALGHEALQTFSDAIVKRFGPEVLEEGRISRPKLGRIVFADAGQRQALEAILHPAIRRRAEERIATSQAKLVVLDAALLLEADWHTICWCVIMVDAPRETRLARVAARSGWDDKELALREAAQMPLTLKRQRANHVIVNDGSLDDLGRQVEHLIQRWGLVPVGSPAAS